MHNNSESWSHEYSQDRKISDNNARIKRAQAFIAYMVSKCRTNSEAQGTAGDLARHIASFRPQIAKKEQSSWGIFWDFLKATDSNEGEDFHHEWKQNLRNSKAILDISHLEKIVDAFFDHIKQSTDPVAGEGIAVSIAQALGAIKSPANPHGMISGVTGFFADLIFSGNKNDNHDNEFEQNQKMREVSNKLDWVESKIRVIDNIFQDALSNSLTSGNIKEALEINKFGPYPNAINLRSINTILDHAIQVGNVEGVRNAITLGAQVDEKLGTELPMLKAIHLGNTGVVAALLEGGADVNSYYKVSCCSRLHNILRCAVLPVAWCLGWQSRATTMLHIAAQSDNHHIAALVYQASNNDVRVQVDNSGHAAAHYYSDVASHASRIDMMQQHGYAAVRA